MFLFISSYPSKIIKNVAFVFNHSISGILNPCPKRVSWTAVSSGLSTRGNAIYKGIGIPGRQASHILVSINLVNVVFPAPDSPSNNITFFSRFLSKSITAASASNVSVSFTLRFASSGIYKAGFSINPSPNRARLKFSNFSICFCSNSKAIPRSRPNLYSANSRL